MEPITRKEVFLNALCADKSCGLEPVSREEILLKRLVEAEASEGGGSGLPAGAKPNQYIVTDGEGNAKWEDKLCWIENTLVDVIPEDTISAKTGRATGVYVDGEISVGDRLDVSWNGEIYSVVVFEDNGMMVCGNLSIAEMGDDTGEPFVMAFDGMGNADVMVKESVTVTVSATCMKDVVHKIADEVLPTSAVLYNTYFDATYIEFGKAYAAFSNGAQWRIAGEPVLSVSGGPDDAWIMLYRLNGDNIVHAWMDYDTGVFKMERACEEIFCLKSPSGSVFRITVDDSGNLKATAT
jgi:hypothetical protein